MVLNAAHKIASVIGDYFQKQKIYFVLFLYSTVVNKNMLIEETRF